MLDALFEGKRKREKKLYVTVRVYYSHYSLSSTSPASSSFSFFFVLLPLRKGRKIYEVCLATTCNGTLICPLKRAFGYLPRALLSLLACVGVCCLSLSPPFSVSFVRYMYITGMRLSLPFLLCLPLLGFIHPSLTSGLVVWRRAHCPSFMFFTLFFTFFNFQLLPSSVLE